MEGFKPQNNKEEKKSHLLKKVRGFIVPVLAAGAMLGVGCEKPTNKDAQNNYPDGFDKTEERIDAKFNEGRKVRNLAAKFGIEVKEGDTIEYQKEMGKVVSFTINGKKYNIDELLNGTSSPSSALPENESEIKISPGAKDF